MNDEERDEIAALRVKEKRKLSKLIANTETDDEDEEPVAKVGKVESSADEAPLKVQKETVRIDDETKPASIKNAGEQFGRNAHKQKELTPSQKRLQTAKQEAKAVTASALKALAQAKGKAKG